MRTQFFKSCILFSRDLCYEYYENDYKRNAKVKRAKNVRAAKAMKRTKAMKTKKAKKAKKA